MNRLFKSLLVSIFVIGVHVSAGHASGRDYELPDVSGHYGVGTTSLPLVDKMRPGIYADGQQSTYREMMLQIWYPTNRGERGCSSEYMDYPSATFLITDFLGLPYAITDYLLLIKTHSILNAKIAHKPENFPVLLFSQGFRMFSSEYQILLEDLASHGYIVIGVNSPNIAGITTFPDGHSYITPDIPDDTAPYVTVHVKDILEDLKFVADQLPVLNQSRYLPVAGRMDIHRIGAMGHSIGGAGAVQSCMESSRIDTAINMDGEFFGDGWKKDIHKPILLLRADHPQPSTWDVLWQYTHSGSYQIHLKESNHLSFSDLPLLARDFPGSNSGETDPTKALQIIRDCVRTFLDSNLKHAQLNNAKSDQAIVSPADFE